MSLNFVPKIRFSFGSGESDASSAALLSRTINPWSKKDLQRLVALRVLSVPYKDIQKRLGRSATACQDAVHRLGLTEGINKKRDTLLRAAMR